MHEKAILATHRDGHHCRDRRYPPRLTRIKATTIGMTHIGTTTMRAIGTVTKVIGNTNTTSIRLCSCVQVGPVTIEQH